MIKDLAVKWPCFSLDCVNMHKSAISKLDPSDQVLFSQKSNPFINYYDFCLEGFVTSPKCDKQYLQRESFGCKGYVDKMWYDYDMARAKMTSHLFDPNAPLDWNQPVCMQRWKGAKEWLKKDYGIQVFEKSNAIGWLLERCLTNFGIQSQYCTTQLFRDQMWTACTLHLEQELGRYQKAVKNFEKFLGF